MVKQELMIPVPDLLDFIVQERLHLPRIKFVEVDDYSVSYIMNLIIQQQDAPKTDQMVMYYANRKRDSDRNINLRLKSNFADPNVAYVNVFGPIAELKEVLGYHWIKKGQPGCTDLMFRSFCNPDPIDDSYLEIIAELKEFSKKHSGLEI